MDDLEYHLAVARGARAAGDFALASEAAKRAARAQPAARARALAPMEVDPEGRAVTIAGVRFERAPVGALFACAVLSRRGVPTCWGFHFTSPNATRNALRRFAEWLADHHQDAHADTVRAIQVYGLRRPATDGTPDPLDGCALLDA